MSSAHILRWLVLLGTPLSLTVVMLFHSSPYSDITGELIPIAGWWTALHTIQFVLFAFMGAALWFLISGLQGGAATVSRIATVVFVLFYDIGDAVAGISTGILARHAANLPATGQAAVAEVIEMLFRDPIKNLVFTVGQYAWILALVAAAIALYQAGAPRVPLSLLAFPVFLMGFDHAFPIGSLTFGSFFLVALWLELTWRREATEKDDSSPAASSTS